MTITRADLDAGRVDFGDIVDPAGEKIGPIHPGTILATEFLEPMGLSANALAKALGVPANRISEIAAGRRDVTADTALRLARYFGMTYQFWMGLQAAYDVEIARSNLGDALDRIAPRAA